MARTPSEVAEILDELADVMYQLAGAVVTEDRLKQAGVAFQRPNGMPFDLRELAADLRAYERFNPVR